ncbi:MAG: SDR family oxidoreductase [Actinomycetaceae bacterium]|nr:SDR family oxidoreductase [Actinomycetaceae bacterium]
MTSQAPTLAITGSTGFIGSNTARFLADEGFALRLLARSPERAPQLPGAVAVRSFYADDAATRESLAGVKTLFMVSGAESPDRLQQHFGLIDAAAACGVEHIVYTSFFGAAPEATFTLARDHYATEEHVKESGLAYTFLRDNFYLDFFAELAGDDGVIRGPAGDGRAAGVARIDVARTAAAVLRNPGEHAGRTYDLTGPESFTLTEVAQALSDHTGHEIRFHDETVEEAYQSRLRWPAEQWEYDAWVSTYTAIKAGELDGVSTAVEDITGRRPLSFAEFLAL